MSKEKRFGLRAISKDKEFLETERFFESVDDLVKLTEVEANIKLRNRLVWFCILMFTFQALLVLLESMNLIHLPEAVLIAVSASMGGPSFGLGGLLFYIARDIYPGNGRH